LTDETDARASRPGARWQALLAPAIFVALGTGILVETLRFGRDFPATYAWTEMLLDYAGGFIRRGLFGQVAWWVDGGVSARVFVPTVLALVYLAIVGFLVFGLRVTRSFAGVVFLLSPIGMLFPILVVPAFGRKDVFIVAALCIGLAVSRWSRESPLRSLVLVLAAYTLCQFFVETVWFYFPLALLVCLFCSRERTSGRWRTTAVVVSLLYAALWMVVQYHASRNADLGEIVRTWRSRYPAVPNRGPIATDFVNVDLRLALALSGGVWKDTSLRIGYGIGLLLALVPTLLLVLERRAALPRGAWRVALVLSAAMAAVPIGLAADWGRYIHLFAGQLFLATFVLTGAPAETSSGPGLRGAAWRVLFVLLFSTTWCMVHWVPSFAGHPVLRPGVIFWLFGLRIADLG
jgi:hypothetical protein